MNWSDERYVRLFTRDTVTWLRWSFETRAVFCLLLRKVDRSGVLETGRDDKAEALALTLMAPIEVCRKALSELMACGTVAVSDTSLVIPRFIEAQEVRMSDKARQKESREKRAVAKLENQASACHTPSQQVTAGHTESHDVTPAVPSRAVPSRAVVAREQVAPPVEPPKRKVKPPDPRHAPLVARLVEAFADDRETAYPFGPRDAKVVSNLLARAEPDVIVAAWERALRHQGYPTVATLAQLEQHLAQFVGAPRADATKGYAQPSVFTETKDVTF